MSLRTYCWVTYLIDGNSVFAHAVGAAPFWSEHLYSAVIANPPTSACVKERNASMTERTMHM
jgi:hypothetical protein